MLYSEPIKQDKSNYVPPEGNANSKIAFVGEYMGKKDVDYGRPFMGNTGNLLFELAMSVGILRNHCYLTGVIKEQPENIYKIISFKRKDVYESEKFKAYRKQLKIELEQTTCNVIVAMGPIALYALCGFVEPKITKRRGSVYESSLLPGRKVIPIINPAAAFRMYEYRFYILIDLLKIKEEMEFPEIKRKKAVLKIFPKHDEVIEYIKYLNDQKKPIAYDIEVYNSQISHVGLTNSSSYAMSICFIKEGKNFFSIEEETDIWLHLAKILQDKNITKIIQNALFDIPYTLRKSVGIAVQGNIYDTMIAQAFLYPDFPKGLDFITTMFTDVPYYKDEGKDNMKTLKNEDLFAQYNARDALVLIEIRKRQIEELEKMHNYIYTMNHMKLIEPLSYMSEKGVLIDKDNLLLESQKAEERIIQLEQGFRQIANIEDINLSSSKQMMNYFYIIKNIKPYLNRSTHNPTIDDNALQRILRKHPSLKEAHILREYRKVSKLKSTYYDMAIDDDNRIRCSWNPVGTRYSRLSSSKNIRGTGGNLQNQPHSMKQYFLADPGYVIYSADLAQADWRIVAYLSEDSNMINALESGKDIHRITASFIFDKDPNKISSLDGSSTFGDGLHSERFWGKKANHAFNYGQSARAFALQMLLPEKQAKLIHYKYLSGYPNIKNVFWEMIKSQLNTDRTITNLFGRNYTFYGRFDNNLLNAAFSYIPQSTVADIMNQRGIIPIYYEDEFKDVEILMQVHDSIVFQISKKLGISAHVRLVKKILENLEQPLMYKHKEFIIPADIEAGYDLHNVKTINRNKMFDNIKDIFNGKII